METRDDRAWLDDALAGRLHRFGHREHIRLAYVALDTSASFGEAVRLASDVIRGIAERHGVPQKYNQTVTEAWVRIIAHCRADAAADTVDSADELVDRYPWLLDKRLLLRHYTSRRLASAAARTGWQPPDVRPIPET
jgi:hypothetical protein